MISILLKLSERCQPIRLFQVSFQLYCSGLSISRDCLEYTGWLVTGGTSAKGVILRKKRSRKYRIKIFLRGFVFEKINFEFSLGTRALYRVSL